MKELDYVKATNLAKIRAAAYIVRDILPGFDGVTEQAEQRAVLKILHGWEDKLSKIIEEDKK